LTRDGACAMAEPRSPGTHARFSADIARAEGSVAGCLNVRENAIPRAVCETKPHRRTARLHQRREAVRGTLAPGRKTRSPYARRTTLMPQYIASRRGSAHRPAVVAPAHIRRETAAQRGGIGGVWICYRGRGEAKTQIAGLMVTAKPMSGSSNQCTFEPDSCAFLPRSSGRFSYAYASRHV